VLTDAELAPLLDALSADLEGYEAAVKASLAPSPSLPLSTAVSLGQQGAVAALGATGIVSALAMAFQASRQARELQRARREAEEAREARATDATIGRRELLAASVGLGLGLAISRRTESPTSLKTTLEAPPITIAPERIEAIPVTPRRSGAAANEFADGQPPLPPPPADPPVTPVLPGVSSGPELAASVTAAVLPITSGELELPEYVASAAGATAAVVAVSAIAINKRDTKDMHGDALSPGADVANESLRPSELAEPKGMGPVPVLSDALESPSLSKSIATPNPDEALAELRAASAALRQELRPDAARMLTSATEISPLIQNAPPANPDEALVALRAASTVLREEVSKARARASAAAAASAAPPPAKLTLAAAQSQPAKSVVTSNHGAEADRLATILKEITVERDRFVHRCTELSEDCRQLTVERNEAAAAREALASDILTLQARCDALASQNDNLLSERDAAAAQIQQTRRQLPEPLSSEAVDETTVLRLERVTARCQELTVRCDELAVQRDELAMRCDELANERDEVLTERFGSSLSQETSRLEADLSRLRAQLDAERTRSTELYSQRKRLQAELNVALTESGHWRRRALTAEGHPSIPSSNTASVSTAIRKAMPPLRPPPLPLKATTERATGVIAPAILFDACLQHAWRVRTWLTTSLMAIGLAARRMIDVLLSLRNPLQAANNTGLPATGKIEASEIDPTQSEGTREPMDSHLDVREESDSSSNEPPPTLS